MLEVHRGRQIEGTSSPVVALATSVNGVAVAAARENGVIEVWSVAAGSEGWHCQLSIPGRQEAHISSLMWCKAREEDDSPLGRLGRLFSSGLDGLLTEWDLHTLQPKAAVESMGGSVWHPASENNINTSRGTSESGSRADDGSDEEDDGSSSSDLPEEAYGDGDGDPDDKGSQGSSDVGDTDIGEEGEPEVDDSVHTFSGHKGAVFSVALSPTDPHLVASGGGDDIGFLWRVGDGDSHRQLEGHSDSVASLAFSTDGQLLASGGLDGIVNVWDSSTGSLEQKLEGPGEAIEVTRCLVCGAGQWVEWHPRGHLVLAGSEDFTAWLWNADSAACMAVFSGHNGAVTCGGFTPDGKTICTGSQDGSFRVWNPKTGESVRVVQGHPFHTEGLTCLSISHDSKIAITGSTDAKACIVNIQSGKVSASLVEHSGSIECVGLSPTLPLAATGGMDGKLIIWDMHSYQPRSTCEHEDGVVKLIWSESELIYMACLDGKIRVWDVRTGNCERIFQGHEDSILDLAVSRDGNAIISGSDDNTARIFMI